MNDRQELFCLEYIKGLNATQAAIRAGYSEKAATQTASRLLTYDNVRARIDELFAEIKSTKIADAEEVLEYLTSVIRGEKDEEIITLNPLGEAVRTKKQIGGREQVKAAELLAKRYGLLTDNVKLNGAAPVQIVDDLGAGKNGG